MSARRALPALALTLLAAAAAVGQAPPFVFAAPAEGDLLLGATEFRFAVAPDAALDRIDVYVASTLAGTARPPEWSFIWTAAELGRDVPVLAVAYREGKVVHRETLRTGSAPAGFSEAIDVDEVPIFPVVTDRQGRYVRGLVAEDFRVLDHGLPADVAFFAAEPADLTVALLLDVSNSMVGKLPVVQEAACEFLDLLRATDLIRVYAFNHSLIETSSEPVDRAAARALVRDLRAAGGTALYDAIQAVLSRLDHERGRKALVVFSDGRDERSLSSLAQAVHAAKGGDVIVYAIGVGESAKDLDARRGLEELAAGTGGRAFFASGYARLGENFRAILEDLRAQYLLAIRPRPGPPGRRNLRVQVSDPALVVRAREFYDHRGEGR
jgi:VWFA-related protein